MRVQNNYYTDMQNFSFICHIWCYRPYTICSLVLIFLCDYPDQLFIYLFFLHLVISGHFSPRSFHYLLKWTPNIILRAHCQAGFKCLPILIYMLQKIVLQRYWTADNGPEQVVLRTRIGDQCFSFHAFSQMLLSGCGFAFPSCFPHVPSKFVAFWIKVLKWLVSPDNSSASPVRSWGEQCYHFLSQQVWETWWTEDDRIREYLSGHPTDCIYFKFWALIQSWNVHCIQCFFLDKKACKRIPVRWHYSEISNQIMQGLI